MSTSTENMSDSLPIDAKRRAVLPTIAALIRNPLETIPPEAFSEPIVFSRIAGKLRAHLLDPVLIHEALVKNAGALSKVASPLCLHAVWRGTAGLYRLFIRQDGGGCRACCLAAAAEL